MGRSFRSIVESVERRIGRGNLTDRDLDRLRGMDPKEPEDHMTGAFPS